MKRYVKSSYNESEEYAYADFNGFSVLIRNNYTGGYGMVVFRDESTAERWYKKLKAAANPYRVDEQLEWRFTHSGEVWQDGISPWDIDSDGMFETPYGSFYYFVNPKDPIIISVL